MMIPPPEVAASPPSEKTKAKAPPRYSKDSPPPESVRRSFDVRRGTTYADGQVCTLVDPHDEKVIVGAWCLICNNGVGDFIPYHPSSNSQGIKRHWKASHPEQAQAHEAVKAATTAVKSTTALGLTENPTLLPSNAKRLKQNHSMSPVHRITVYSNDDMDGRELLTDYANVLEYLMGMDSATFRTKYFRKQAVHVQGPPQRYDAVRSRLFDLDVREILQNTSSDNVFVWLKNHTNGLIHSVETDADTAYALHEAQHATYCRAPPDVEQRLVAALLNNTQLGCGQYDPEGSMNTLARGEVEVFCATHHHTTDWHYDFQENFTLQLSGTKRWLLQHSTVEHPLRGATPHYRSPGSVEPQLKAARLADPNFTFGHPKLGKNARGPIEDIILRPGDALYFPAGMWHKVIAEDPGVSINVSLMATNYAHITCNALEHLLLRDDRWRACVTADQDLDQLLRELPATILQFWRDGGAAAILPRALQPTPRVPSWYTQANIEDTSSDDDGDLMIDHDENVGEMAAGDSPYGSPLDGRSELRQFGMEAWPLYNQQHRIVTNPLASLISPTELQQFYQQILQETYDEHNGNNFVLNVNFAGNEAHESSIRIELENDGKILPALSNHKRGGDVTALLTPLVVSNEDVYVVDSLLFYGYLVTVKAVHAS